jgi:hypothetical protein
VKGFLIVLLLFSLAAIAQVAIPAGTILPIELSSSLQTQKSKPGQRIRARIMQDVPLSRNQQIKAGTKVSGEVLSASPMEKGQFVEISFRFDTLQFKHGSIPLSTSLRALASMMEVQAAQTPRMSTDRGMPWAWRTRDLVGGEAAYGEGGPVTHGEETVGRALADGVLVRVRANQRYGCRDEAAGNTQLQALWIFSSDACGLYGVNDAHITHTGRTDPEGVIKIGSNRGKINIRSGSAMLLSVNSTTE